MTGNTSDRASNRLSKAFSIRERNRSSKPRAAPSDYNGLFTLDDNAKKLSKDEEKKVQDLHAQLSALGSNHIPQARIEYALRAQNVNGDISKAWDLLTVFDDSTNGVLRRYSPTTKLLGANNRQRVTCWIDSLLFAMFLKPTVFEALLYHDYADQPRKQLVTVLRLYVNMLRSGRIITEDITKQVQDAMAACGWAEAAHVRQQDASEAFVFLTDKLELPLLTLKTDLFHSGSDDNDDHKFITERLLDVAVPEDVPKDSVVSLEHCLEEYFNNKVEVKRGLRRQTTLKPAATSESAGGIHIESVELSGDDSNPSTPQMSRASSTIPARPAHIRAPSIFSERRVEVFNGVEKHVDKPESVPAQPQGRPRGASVRKEVLMPAWQFLNLIPWYTDQCSSVNTQIRSHFSAKRPMLGICLKRYTVTKEGNPTRLATKIDIPLEMIPPHFAVDEAEQGEGVPNPGLKLTLQAVVCHRGNYVTSGHYISLVRVRAAPAAGSSSNVVSRVSSRGAEEDVWLRHDDLPLENKVSTVDIKAALEHEMPYLLFYQVLPIDAEDEPAEEPPPYQESDAFSLVNEKLSALPANQPGRLSTEVADYSRRGSTALSEESRGRRSSVMDVGRTSVVETGLIPENKSGQASTVGTAATTPGEEGKTNPLANMWKPAARSAKSSRPGSDSSEKVLTKISSRLSKDKLTASETTVEVTDEISVEDATPRPTRKDGSRHTVSESRERRSRLMMRGINRHGSVKRRGKDKGNEIDRECRLM